MDDVLQALVLVQRELADSKAETAALREKVDRQACNPFDASSSNPQIHVTVPPPVPLATPERYSGDPHKIQTFLTQIALHFSCRPASFPNNLSRVAFAISYLSWDAADWAVPLVRNDSPLLSDWEGFRKELERVFDRRATTFSADKELLTLRQGKKDLVSYMMVFNRLIVETA
ncbi:protein LDOC1-like [Lissotriton helveticus]